MLPKFLYGWCTELPSQTALRRLDSELRLVVKGMFFLHPSTTDDLMYARPRDKGLVFPRLSKAYPLIFLRHCLKLPEGRPLPLLERLLEINHFEGRLATVARSIEVDWPITLQGLTRTKQTLLREESRSWAGLVSQGHGVGAFRNDPSIGQLLDT